jgi:hypothetical protein
LAADQRLNHVVKGRCGSAISAVETFRELLGPYLKQDLPSELADLLVAPICHLREAIEWCHRRQVFVQLEKGSYLSRHTAVDINQLIRSRLGSAGSLQADVAEALALDETVLRIAFDEVLSNALKYGKKMVPLRIHARFELEHSVLQVSFENDNPDDFVPLTLEECERVMLPGYKSHTCSAMSDGLGLDSVSCAVRAAAGSVKLEQNATSTVVHVWLPATLRRTSSQQATPEGTKRAIADSSAAAGHDPWASPDVLPPEPVEPNLSWASSTDSLLRGPQVAENPPPPAVAGLARSVDGSAHAPGEFSSCSCGGTDAADSNFDQTPNQRHAAIVGEEPELVAPCVEAPGGDVRTETARGSETDVGSHTGAQLPSPQAPCGQGEAGSASGDEQCPVPSPQEQSESAKDHGDGTEQPSTQPPLAALQPAEPETVAPPTPGAGAPAAEAPAARGLRVVGLDDEKIPRMVQGLFMLHHLHANMQESCTLGETREEILAIVDVALGVLHADLTPNTGEVRQADVVLLDENIMPPDILGSKIATELRGRGFAGVIVVLTGATSTCVENIRSIAAVDFVRRSC